MKKLLRYLKPYTKESIIAPLFKLLEAGFDLMVPFVVRRIMDDAIPAGDTAQIWQLCGVLVLFALVGLACSITAQYFAARAAVGFGTDLRRELFRHSQRYSYGQTDRVGTSTLITRMTPTSTSCRPQPTTHCACCSAPRSSSSVRRSSPFSSTRAARSPLWWSFRCWQSWSSRSCSAAFRFTARCRRGWTA